MHRNSNIFALGLAALVLLVSACTGNRPETLGSINNRLSPCPPSPNCVSSFASDAEHKISPYPVTGPPEKFWTQLKHVLNGMERVHIVTDQEHYLHAEFTSRWFRFVDDVEFLLDAKTKTLHFRSASRTGYGDMGVNRERMEIIRQRLSTPSR